MGQRITDFELASLNLSVGDATTLEFDVYVEPFSFGGQEYSVEPDPVPVQLDISKIVGGGYALSLKYKFELVGPCTRCLTDARVGFEGTAREVEHPGGGEELTSPYVEEDLLRLSQWLHDVIGLSLPTKILCQPDCAGICPECGANLNEVDKPHGHGEKLDPRWGKLRSLNLD